MSFKNTKIAKAKREIEKRRKQRQAGELANNNEVNSKSSFINTTAFKDIAQVAISAYSEFKKNKSPKPQIIEVKEVKPKTSAVKKYAPIAIKVAGAAIGFLAASKLVDKILKRK